MPYIDQLVLIGEYAVHECDRDGLHVRFGDGPNLGLRFEHAGDELWRAFHCFTGISFPQHRPIDGYAHATHCASSIPGGVLGIMSLFPSVSI